MYTRLRDELGALVSTHWASRQAELASHAGAGPLPALAPEPLKTQVRELWAGIPQQESAAAGRADVIRSTLDLVGRDIAVRPIVDLEIVEPRLDSPDSEKAGFHTALQDRLDIILTLFEVVYETNEAPSLEPGEVFIPLLEEFVELLLVSTWHELFSYVESRAPRFTKNMPASRGKALPLLRTINAFLRFLSHTPEDLTLRGRAQLFASRVISVADKSATNLRGEYSQITTTWEEDEPEAAATADGDGDVQMNDPAKPSQPDFYSTLWSLQQYFAHPPSLDGPATGEPAQTPFEVFRTKSDFVLGRLFEQTVKERVLLGKNPERKRKRDHGFESYPRYLTARSLTKYEIADASFRRQILLQYFILFQFLLNLTPGTATKQQFTGGMPKTFVVDGENQTWIKHTVTKVREELCRMQSGGREFEATVVQLMNRERRYAQWKNDGCPESEWELTIADQQDAAAAAQKWKRHCAPTRRWPHKLGTAALSRTWANGYKSMDDFFDHPVKTQTVFELEEILTKLEDEEDLERGFGREPTPELVEQKRTVKWLALRAARREYPRLVASQQTDYDLHELVKIVKGRGKKAAEVAPEGGAEAEVAADAEAEATPEAEEGAEDNGQAAEVEVEAEKAAEPPVDASAAPAEEPVASEEANKMTDVDEASAPKDVNGADAIDVEAAGESAEAPADENAGAEGGAGEDADADVAKPNGHGETDVPMAEAAEEAEEDDLIPPPGEDAE